MAAGHQHRTVLFTWNWHTFCQLHVLFLFPCRAAVAEITCCEEVRARSPVGLLCGFWSMEMEGVCRPCSQLCRGKDSQALCTVGIGKRGVLLLWLFWFPNVFLGFSSWVCAGQKQVIQNHTQKGFGSSSTHTSTKSNSKENSFHVAAVTEEYHFTVQNHYGIARPCINLVYITQSSVHQLKINNWVFWKEWYILLTWGFHVGNIFFWYWRYFHMQNFTHSKWLRPKKAAPVRRLLGKWWTGRDILIL